MYDKYLEQLNEAGKIRNLKERSITCYKNYVSYFLNYISKDPEDLTCQDVRAFLLAKKDEGLKATTLNLYNSAIRFFYRNVLHILWDDVTVPRMILDHKLPSVLNAAEIESLLDATDDLKYRAMSVMQKTEWTVIRFFPKGILRSLRNTGLMEQGVEQRNIQTLLGHRDPKSTEIYLHVSNKSLMGIQSPFDLEEGAAHE